MPKKPTGGSEIARGDGMKPAPAAMEKFTPRMREDPAKKAERRDTAFHNSVVLTDNALFRKMAETCPDINSRDLQGRTVLMKVTAAGDMAKAIILRELGAVDATARAEAPR